MSVNDAATQGFDPVELLQALSGTAPPGAAPGTAAGVAGLPTAPAETTPQFQEGGLDKFLETVRGLSNVQGNPRSFGSGVALGLAHGIGGAGNAVAQRRAEFNAQQAQASKQRALADLVATKAAAAASTAQDKEDETHTTVTPEDVQANPMLSRWVGKAVPTDWFNPTKSQTVTPDDVKADPTLAPHLGQTVPTSRLPKATKPASGTVGPISDDEFAKQYALPLQLYATTAKTPTFGRGNNTAATWAQFYRVAGNLYPNASIASNMANFRADQGALSKLQSGQALLEAAHGTYTKNAAMLRSMLPRIPDVGSPALNGPLRRVWELSGNPDVPAYHAALHVVQQEATRLLAQGLSGGGQVTDTAKSQLDSVINGNYTRKQMGAVLDLLDTDANNRVGSGRDAITTVRSRLSANPAAAAAGGNGAGATPAPAARMRYDPTAGKLVPVTP